MNLLTRYLAKEIYLSVLIVFAALLMLFELLDLINQMNEMGESSGYHMGYVLLFVLLTAPNHIYELFPVAVLIGTIFCFWWWQPLLNADPATFYLHNYF